MRTLTLLISLSIFSINLLLSQRIDFSRTYGGQGYQDARSIVSCNDGGFVYTGLNKGSVDSLGDMYLTKINAAGAVLWEHFYGLPKEDGGNFLMKTQDNGFIISGHTAYNYGSSCNGYIIKTNSEGEEIWKRFVGTAFDDVCNGAVQNTKGDYYFTGRVEDPETNNFDVMLCKIAQDGTYEFMKTFGGQKDDIGYKIIETIDGNLLIVGYSENEETKKESLYLIKCDLEGNLIWELRTMDTNVNTRAYAGLLSENGDLIVVGGIAKYKNKQSIQSAFISIIDNNGVLKSFKLLMEEEGKSYGYDLCKNNKNEFAITGSITPNNESNNQPFILVFNKNLEILDHKIIPHLNETRTVSIINISDRDFLLAGKSKKEGDSDILINRVNLYNSTSTNAIQQLPYTLFPNPMLEYTYLRIENTPSDKVLNLYDSQGHLVSNYDFKGNELFLYRENLIKGMYYFKIIERNGKLVTSGSILIQ